MKKIKTGGQFRKDIKRYSNKPDKLRRLYAIVELLRNEEPVPNEFRPHKLTGDYVGCMECHIESDFLLVWIDEEKKIIKLLRLGTHSELFGR